MSWKDPGERHSDNQVQAIHDAAKLICTHLDKGFKLMADAQTQALADLGAAVTAMTAAVNASTAVIAQLVAANGNMQPDDSAAIEAQVTAINQATAALNAAIPAPAPAPTPAPPATT